jgi:hypothetical protein
MASSSRDSSTRTAPSPAIVTTAPICNASARPSRASTLLIASPRL